MGVLFMTHEVGYIPIILNGLLITLGLSLISLLIGIFPGFAIIKGMKSKVKFIKILCLVYMHIFDGIPLLVQIFFFYYGLPMLAPALAFSQIPTAIIILSLNAGTLISMSYKTYTEKDTGFSNTEYIKLVILSSGKAFAELIKYTTLLSLIGLTDFFRAVNTVSQTISSYSLFIYGIIVYLALNIIIKLIVKSFERKLLNLT